MDAPIASIGMPQPAPPRPVELDRVQPAPSASAPSGRPPRKAPTFADVAAEKLDSRLNAQRSIERDGETGALVYRLIEVATGTVTFQTPNDAQLKLRAYIDGVIAAETSHAVEVVA